MPFDIVAGGQGLAEDVALVAAELARLPAPIAVEFAKKGLRVVACRFAVTDFATELAAPNQVPEGWPPGSSWTAVPGAYIPARHAVVIATRGPDAGGARRIPVYGEGHGARSLAVHETIHGYDYASNKLKSRDPAFRSAWTSDLPLLGSAYFSGPTWGPRESFAESAAQHFGSDQSQANMWPHLATYWSQFQPFTPSILMRLSASIGDLFAPIVSGRQSIGRGVIEADGTIHLDLDAHGKGGVIGHGRLSYRPGEERYGAVRDHIAPRFSPMGASAPEGAAEPAAKPTADILVRPFP